LDDPTERDEFDVLVEALIEEARQRQRRRRRIYMTVIALVGLLGVAVFAIFERSAQSQTASPVRTVAVLGAGTVDPKIAFVSTSREMSEIYVMAGNGSGLRRLSTQASSDTPAWSPDGRRVAFVRRRDGKGDLYVMNMDGTAQRNLTRNPADSSVPLWSPEGYVSSPVWSPDGRTIAFVRAHAGTGRWRYGSEIHVVNSDASEKRNLTRNPAPDIAPAWSPDGRRIAFLRERDFGKFDVVVMNADGSRQHTLARFSSDGTPAWSPDPPVWSPNGRSIAFVSHRDGTDEIFVVSIDGSGKRNLTRNPARDFAPVWAPDGSKIAFVRVRGGNFEVFAMSPDGSGQQRLVKHAMQPAWSPDGATIAFISVRTGNQEVFVMNADGSGRRMLTRRPATDDHSVSWSPTQTR
jgi:Tol biopolymer transport system component